MFSILALSACEEGENEALMRLEGLSFVPAADHSLAAQPYSTPEDWGLETAILMGRFEVTRGDFLAHLKRVGARPIIPTGDWVAHSYDWNNESLALPAEMTYGEAERYAEEIDMRLPSAREWLHVALGRTGQWYPWGGRDQESVCNTVEAGIGGPTLVGTFASGRSPLFDCYDLVGNLAEWTSSYVPGQMDSTFVKWFMTPAGASSDWKEPAFVSVMGGSYSSPRSKSYSWPPKESIHFNSRTMDKGSVSAEIGARMCADAEDYLWKHAGAWGVSQLARQRIRAVGSRWANDRFAREQLGAMLQRLVLREGAAPALGWLAAGVEGDVPGG